MTRKGVLRVAGAGLLLVFVLYVGAAVALMTRENAMVFPGSTWNEPRNVVPSQAAGIAWDTTRIESMISWREFLLLT